jgi:hypothetical protein
VIKIAPFFPYKIDCLLLSESLLNMATLPAKRFKFKSQAEWAASHFKTEISSGKRVCQVKQTEDSEVCGLQYGAQIAATSMVAHLA